MNRIYTESDDDVYFLLLEKGVEKYVFLYNRRNSRRLLRLIGRYASDDDLSLSWKDAAELAVQVQH